MPTLVNWNVLCWNVCSLNSDDKQLALLNAIRSSGCAVVCLQETKKTSFDLPFIKSCCPRNLDQFAFVASRGASGGIATIWNSSIFSAITLFSKDFALVTRFRSTQSAQNWTLVNIYGPCQGEQRNNFIQWLLALDIPSHEDWLFVGDFNFIRAPDNRNKPGGSINDMIAFNDFIRAQSLIELPIKGRSFTWSNMQVDPLLEQLDWVFTSTNWTTSYPKTLVKPLSKPVSDHTPCVVSIETTIPRSKLFRFESYWIQHPGFMDVVAKSWAKQVKSTNTATSLCRKLKNLRRDLKQWSKGISKLIVAIENSNKALNELDELENKRTLSIPKSNFRKFLKAHILRLLKYQQMYWKKRCTVRWVKFGDENSKKFQALASERYMRNNIASLSTTDGVTIEDHVGKESIIFETYKGRMGTATPHNMKFDLS
jgi:exonuclease III